MGVEMQSERKIAKVTLERDELKLSRFGIHESGEV